MNVEQLMTKSPATCKASDSLNDAARLMWDYDCGAVPIVDELLSVIGILTDRDICMAAYTQGRLLSEIPVSVAMAQRVFTCHPNDSLEAVEQVMRERQVRRLPVVDPSGELLGIVTLNDVAQYLAQVGQHSSTASDHEFVETAASIGTPREGPRPLPRS